METTSKVNVTVNLETAGGTRFNAGKPGGWWYAPILGLRLVAPVWMQGAEKYAPKDWRVGQSFSVLIDCAFRHMLEVVDKGPKSRCPESGNLHAAHAVWNLLCMLTLMVLGRDDCDDVTKWEGVTTGMKEEMEKMKDLDVVVEKQAKVLADVGAQLLKPVLVEQLQKKSTEALEAFGKAVRDHIGPPLDISKLKEGMHPPTSKCTCIIYGGDYDKRRALNLNCPEHGKGDPELDDMKEKEGMHPALRGDPATLPSWEPAPELKPLAEEVIKDAVDKIESGYTKMAKTDHMWEGAPVLADFDPTARTRGTPEPTPREMAREQTSRERVCHVCRKPRSQCRASQVRGIV